MAARRGWSERFISRAMAQRGEAAAPERLHLALVGDASQRGGWRSRARIFECHDIRLNSISPPIKREKLLTPQLPLDFHERGKRGGARPGAGRPPKKESERKFIAHRERESHRKWDPVHVTLRVMRRLPSLRRQSLENIVKLAMLAQRKDLKERHRLEVAALVARGELTAGDAKGPQHFQVVHFTIQHDHLHLIVEAPTKRALAGGVKGLEIRIARRINKELGRKGRFWADRYHRRDLRARSDMRNVLRYVLLNSQKHHPVIGDRCFADPHSSAATFDGFARPPFVFDDPNRWPRVVPRTWLLNIGWREHGLIDPADTPPRHRIATEVQIASRRPHSTSSEA